METSTPRTAATPTVQCDEPATSTGLTALLHEVSEYVGAYIGLVKDYDFVESVYATDGNEVAIYTVYRGERRAISDRIYEAYGQVIDRFPNMPVDFRLLNYDRLDVVPLPSSAHKLYPPQRMPTTAEHRS